jgi:tetrahydromethanopterin S-methyltransferase subunit G
MSKPSSVEFIYKRNIKEKIDEKLEKKVELTWLEIFQVMGVFRKRVKGNRGMRWKYIISALMEVNNPYKMTQSLEEVFKECM